MNRLDISAPPTAPAKHATPRRRNLISAFVDLADIEVEVDLADVETATLRDELVLRGAISPEHCYGEAPAIDAIYNALARGLDATALRLMRTFIQDLTGRVLP